MEIIPNRVFSSIYIAFDICFLLFFSALLFVSKRRRALLFGLFGGLLYFAVDYGIFYLMLHSRVVTGAPTGLFLFYLSMSYGFTNFAWIYLMLDEDEKRIEWTVLIFFSWIAVALLSQNFGSAFNEISIYRTTASYHGVMALILIVGYAVVIVLNVMRRRKINIPYLLLIGIGVQFGWEFALYITGIRRAGLNTLVIDSLIETNLGMPYLYFIHAYITKKLGKETHYAA